MVYSFTLSSLSFSLQGRNLSGKIGLFPQSYTTPAPPTAEALVQASSTSTSASTPTVATSPAPVPISIVAELAPSPASQKTPLHALDEESETDSAHTPLVHPSGAGDTNGDVQVHPTNGHTPALTNGLDPAAAVPAGGPADADGAVMKATMTDVQQALEQLGRTRGHSSADPDGDTDGGASVDFSFASAERDTETEADTDTDGGEGEGWHAGARRRLAETARRAVAEAEKMEAILAEGRAGPPIEVEMSDESEGEDDELLHGSGRLHPHISEAEEEEELDTTLTHDGSSRRTSRLSAKGSEGAEAEARAGAQEEEVRTATAAHTSFPASTFSSISPGPPSLSPSPVPVLSESPAPASDLEAEKEAARTQARSSLPTPISPTAHGGMRGSHASAPPTQPYTPQPYPTLESASLSRPVSGAMSPGTISSSISAGPGPGMASPVPAPVRASPGVSTAPPTEWSVEEVVEWLRSRGFDQDVCDKFTGMCRQPTDSPAAC